MYFQTLPWYQNTCDRFKNENDPQNIIGQSLSNQDRDILIIYSPKNLPTQVLRSNIYSFDDNFVDKLMEVKHNGSLAEGMSPAYGGRYKEIAGAIMPNDDGVFIDTATLTQQYSFVLILHDQMNNLGSRVAAIGPKRTIYAVGYFVGNEEPINPITNTINFNAVLAVTHVYEINGTFKASSGGFIPINMLSKDIDIVDTGFAQYHNGNTSCEMFSSTPSDLMQKSSLLNNDNNSPEISFIPTPISEKPLIDSIHRSPKSELNDVLQSIDKTSSAKDPNSVYRTSDTITGPDYADAYRSMVITNLSPTSMPYVSSGSLVLTKPFTMGMLNASYPNIDVQPMILKKDMPWGIFPQDRINRTNTMSSLVASMVTSCMSTYKLASLSFRYSSYDINNPNNKDGVYQILDASTMQVLTPQESQRQITNCMNELILTLMTMLKTINGDFDLMGCFSLFGDVLINLVFMDDYNNIGAGDYYQTNTRLGGLTNPAIGNGDTAWHNANQINALVDACRSCTEHSISYMNYNFNNLQGF